ncbi:MAG: hypothetical protein PHO32_09645, partial [Candidatus Cloacimonetes bacterium]|nr:hypothetical protein [Candidatus Cloacimonadota bacterium]
MLFTFSNLTTDNGLQDFNMEFEAKGCTVLFDSCETLSRGVLSALVGLDEILAGSLLIDGIPQKMYFSRNQLIATLGLVFDEGIMLSNLSLKENILLPWRKRFEGGNLSSFEQQLKKWMELLKMDTDLSLRPAHVSPATRKFLGYVRAMLLKPKLLLIDDPYYLFNK